jgi:aerobic carbon-monoxide dehydrogenase small subunit
MSMTDITLTVNGRDISAAVEPRTLLVEFLRETLRLTGTHVGCDTSQCGACTVHIDERSVKACTMLAVQADGCAVTTIEGIAAKDGALHPMQAAFREHHGLQCGFCTPGMVMSALALVERTRGETLTGAVIRAELEGNLCRCTGYQAIVASVAAGAQAMGAKVEQA